MVGGHEWLRRGMHGLGWHAWLGVCVAGGGHVWLGVCMAWGVHGLGECIAEGMHD